jgi:hypothetical protein
MALIGPVVVMTWEMVAAEVIVCIAAAVLGVLVYEGVKRISRWVWRRVRWSR